MSKHAAVPLHNMHAALATDDDGPENIHEEVPPVPAPHHQPRPCRAPAAIPAMAVEDLNALETPDVSDDEGAMVAALQTFAHSVQTGAPKSQKQRRAKTAKPAQPLPPLDQPLSQETSPV